MFSLLKVKVRVSSRFALGGNRESNISPPDQSGTRTFAEAVAGRDPPIELDPVQVLRVWPSVVRFKSFDDTWGGC